MENSTQTANIKLLESGSVFRWTIDVEGDHGGRTSSLQGIEEGVPYILDELDKVGAKAIFFISTEYLDRFIDIAKLIASKGHVIGSHGHEHKSWKFRKWWEWRLDRLKSVTELKTKLGILGEKIPYRAPKFSYVQDGYIYSNPKNHHGLLKGMWTGRKPKPENIIYLHPFDLVEPKTTAPNLFCKFWYSKSKDARKEFERLVRETEKVNN